MEMVDRLERFSGDDVDGGRNGAACKLAEGDLGPKDGDGLFADEVGG